MRILNTTYALSISVGLLDAIDDMGFPAEEAIPGLVQAIVELAGGSDAVLSEASDLLADGGVE